MTPLHHHHAVRGRLAHHPSGPQNHIVSLEDCMELVTCPNECFVQVGFRNWPPHMHMSHTYVPAHAHATATEPPHGYTHASQLAAAPAHSNSGSTCVTQKG
ncbi:hypothetical protein O181_041552 [Austropuccinia psidii MF-1]|uniref:Uncharacterized protein n=1 Tax=Austropuccinia psidii MF-1 TaxID=1389203 RepID=A0A9Q3HEY7_9BASI|nr:hypothetical protein [Austropuccinia psidii MF-1]